MKSSLKAMGNSFAVIGNPVKHSLSPRIHQWFAQQTGQTIQYEKIEIAEPFFEKRVIQFFNEGGKGLNVTMPFKERAFAMLDVASPRCQTAKAANTLWMKEGLLHGDNTDGIGLIRDLSTFIELTQKHVLILGAGGATRGIINPLLEHVARLSLVNRNIEKRRLLQQEFPDLHTGRLDNTTLAYDLIINARPMHAPPPLSLQFHATTYCYDLNYSLKEITPFLAWALDQGSTHVRDGRGMLIEQAAEAFYIWHEEYLLID